MNAEKQQLDIFGTDPHELHRAVAIDTSVAAAYSVDTASDEKKVFDLVKAAGTYGATMKELEPAMGKHYHAFSGRFSALLRKGLIEDSGKRRDKCRVVIVKGANSEQQ
jgi:hypothetical protein